MKALVYTLHKFEKRSVLYVKYCGGEDNDFIGGEGFFLTSCFQSLSGRPSLAIQPSLVMFSLAHFLASRHSLTAKLLRSLCT